MIPAGRLNRQATLKRPPSAADALGLRKLKHSDYTTVDTFRCAMESLGASEQEVKGGTVMVASWRILARAASIPTVLPNDRIVIDGRVLAIGSIIDENGDGIMLSIDCEEVIE